MFCDMYLIKCVVFIIIYDYISADSEEITKVSFNISMNGDIPTCTNNPVRGPVVFQQKFQVSATSKDKPFASNATTCFFNNKTENPIHLKREDDKHLFVTTNELLFKQEMDGHQLICELGLNMSQNPDNKNNLSLNSYDRSYTTAKCDMSIHLEITKVSFNISMNGDIPTCTNNPVRGPIIAQQKFQVSATSKDKPFANVTTCFFNNTSDNSIHLEPQEETNLFVASDELYFTPKMDGDQLICELGLLTTNWTFDNRRNSTATCVMSIHLVSDNQTRSSGGIANNEIDYKNLTIIGFSLASVFLMICLAQSVALCICVPKGRLRKKKGERTNTNSIISDSGTIYEELKPVDIETLTVDERDKKADPPRSEKNGKKGIMAMFSRRPKSHSHPPPVTEPTQNLPDPPRPENNGKKGIMAWFAKHPKSDPPQVTESTLTLPDPPRAENNCKKGIMARFSRSPKSHLPPVKESTLPDPPHLENNGKKGTMARFAKTSPEYHPSPVHNSTLTLPGVNPSSARPHVLQEEIYSNEYVPEPTSVENKAPPRPPKPIHQLKPPLAKKRIRQQKFEGKPPTPVKSSKRISEIVSKLEGNLKPAVAHGIPVTSVLKPKGYVVTSEQHVPVQHQAWSPPPRTPVVPTQHHLEDERMDSEDSEDWTYEDLEEIYEMPEP